MRGLLGHASASQTAHGTQDARESRVAIGGASSARPGWRAACSQS